MPKLGHCCAAVLLLAIPNIISATVITFSGLTGSDGDPFPSPYTESGYIVTALTPNEWVQGQDFGNPVPSIFVGAGVTPLTMASIEITKVGGGSFRFSGIDLASNGDTIYAITGIGFDETGSIGPIQDFTTITSNDALLALTSLTITMTPDSGAVSYNIDNIVLNNVVPEPTPGIMGIAGLGLLWLFRRCYIRVGFN